MIEKELLLITTISTALLFLPLISQQPANQKCQMKKCLFHAVELVKWSTFLAVADCPTQHYEDIAEFSQGDEMEWTFQLTLEYIISKCKYLI